jgi:hypothetical protein
MDQRDDSFTIPTEVTVTLKVPLKKAASSETLSQLSFRPPKVKEMKLVTERIERLGEVAGGIFMMSLFSNDKLTDADVGELNFLDMQICMEAIEPYLKLVPKAPATSSS